jgi:hypothetical protein
MVAQNTLWPRVVQNLTLRVAPDPRAGKVIAGPPLNDAIPIGAVVQLRYTDLKVDCHPYRVAGVVHTIWCPVSYAGHGGWVIYLDAGNGRLSCLIDSTSRDCNQAAQATLGPR